MTQYRTIYNKDTGEIVRVMRMNDDMLATNLSNNPHWAYINAETFNYRQKRVDLTTLQIVDAPILPDIAEYIRSKRANLLLTSDWTDTLSAKTRLGDDLYNQWQTYRQALRDMPATQQVNSIEEIVWPSRP